MEFIISRIVKTFMTVLLTAVILIVVVFGGMKIWQLSTSEQSEKIANNEPTETINTTSNNSVIDVEVLPIQISENSLKDPRIANSFTKTGLILADQEVEVFPEVTAQITELLVQEGQEVKRGQLIARIGNSTQLNQSQISYNSAIRSLNLAEQSLKATQTSNLINQSTFQNQIKAAELNIQQATQQLSTNQLLRSQQSELAKKQAELTKNNTEQATEQQNELQTQISNIQKDITETTNFNQDSQGQTQIITAFNQLDQLSKQLANTKVQSQLQEINAISQINQIRQQIESAQLNLAAGRITSPINGIISSLPTRPGQRVTPNAPIMTITNFQSIIVQTSVTPQELFKINEQTSASINVLDQNIPAKIIAVSRIANAQSKTINIKVIPVENPDVPFIPNTFAKVKFSNNPVSPKISNTSLPKLPISILNFTSDGAKVAIVKNNLIAYKPVSLGPITNGHVEIKSGLNNNDNIVITPTHLPEGTKVSVK